MWLPGIVCLALYLLCCLWFISGALVQLHLVWQAKKKTNVAGPRLITGDLPSVTIQVPVYNERYVIARLLNSLGELDYPRNRFDIQILDDSTDDTSIVIDEAAMLLRQKGINTNIIRRTDRSGYKAGALQAGLAHCRGELVAIFDADFVPTPDFLSKMTSYFEDPAVGGVQSRWRHLNLYQNSLTKVQAFLLDSHFNLEQRGRAAAGYFVNFCGTAGLWRKQAIISSGGWNGSVLAEDLELSYRAQLDGWKFLYDDEVTVPAELPADMEAFKLQQFRWAKGMAQAASKHLKKVWKAPVSKAKKIHAAFHLLGSVSFVAVFGNILLALPLLAGRQFLDGYRPLSNIILATGITLPLLCTYYYFGTASSFPRRVFWSHLPLFLVIYMALSVQNTVAVLQGLVGHTSPFIRTPKSSDMKLKKSIYAAGRWTPLNTIELLALLYVCLGIGLSIYWGDGFLLLFLLMVLTGLLILLFPSIKNELQWEMKFSG